MLSGPACYSTGIVLLGFLINISLVNTVKWIFVTYPSFNFPLFVTSVHMLASWLVALAAHHVFNLVPNWQPMPLSEQARRVFPFAAFGALSIACGSGALITLFPSFHEVIQSTSPAATLLVVLVAGRRSANTAAYLAMIPVCAGAALVASREAELHVTGVALSVLAVVFRAIKTHIQSELLSGGEKISSLTLLLYMSPFNLVIFAAGSLLLEGLAPAQVLLNPPAGLITALALSGGVAAAFNLMSYLLVAHLGAVGAVVMNNMKTPCTMLVSWLLFGNSITATQLLGAGIVMLGVWAYNKYGRLSEPKASCPRDLELGSSAESSARKDATPPTTSGESDGSDSDSVSPLVVGVRAAAQPNS